MEYIVAAFKTAIYDIRVFVSRISLPLETSATYSFRFVVHLRLPYVRTAYVQRKFEIACVSSFSVGFGSKERPRNGIFGILPARKMEREPIKRKRGMEEVKKGNSQLVTHNIIFTHILRS